MIVQLGGTFGTNLPLLAQIREEKEGQLGRSLFHCRIAQKAGPQIRIEKLGDSTQPKPIPVKVSLIDSQWIL